MNEIIVSGNRAYFPSLLFLALSLRKTQPHPFRLFLLTGDFSSLRKSYLPLREEERSFLEKVLKETDPETEVKLCDLTETVLKECPKISHYSKRYTPYSFLRVFADKLPLSERKALYLDLDMVVLKDLSPLFDLDLREDDYGMVKDPVASAFRHRPFANSGLILFSLPAVIANDTLGKVREDFERHPRFEQTLLNRDGQVFFLPPEYNEQKTTRPETAVRHYPGYFRPFPFPHVDAIRPADEEKFRKRYPGVYQDLFSLYETYLSSYSSLDA